jgi:hypothetical protein
MTIGEGEVMNRSRVTLVFLGLLPVLAASWLSAGGSGGGNGCAIDLRKLATPTPGDYVYAHIFDEHPDGWEVLDYRGYRQNAHDWVENYLLNAETHPTAAGSSCGVN